MARPFPVLQTARLRLCLPDPQEAALVLDYYVRNREHLEQWEPRRGPEFFTLGFWERQLEAGRSEYRRDAGARFLVRMAEDDERYVGVANLSNVVRGAFQACHLGYSLDAELQGQGLMGEALEAVLAFAFEELQLHRVMANYQPHNERSARVLERLGFVREGFARDYLFIDGEWRDHILTALTAPK